MQIDTQLLNSAGQTLTFYCHDHPELWEAGWFDGDHWRLCESGGVIDGRVLYWARPRQDPGQARRPAWSGASVVPESSWRSAQGRDARRAGLNTGNEGRKASRSID